MILIGDEFIPYENISKITTITDIERTKSNSTLLFSYDIELIKYCHKNSLNFAVIVKDIKELIYSSQFDTKYIICTKDLSLMAQKIADNYLFDSKILVTIVHSDEIQWVAQNEIDGAIYKDLI